MTRVLVTGSSGHLGEALVRSLKELGHEVIGVDISSGPFTTYVGSIADRNHVRHCMDGVQTVYHTATLHKPHIATHSRQDFVDTNITGTLNLLEESVKAKAGSFVYTSTTSVFGDAMAPSSGKPAAWVTEDLTPIPKNIYGVTKAAAEDLCQIFSRNKGLATIVLRTSRFFPEDDDNRNMRSAYCADNMKMNEFLHRRIDIEDVVSAHLLAAKQASGIGFRNYIVSATTPFSIDDLDELRENAPNVVRRKIPHYEEVYARLGWEMFPSIDRVYVNEKIRRELGWNPRYDFAAQIDRLSAGEDLRSPLARLIGSKGYHDRKFVDEPFPVE